MKYLVVMANGQFVGNDRGTRFVNHFSDAHKSENSRWAYDTAKSLTAEGHHARATSERQWIRDQEDRIQSEQRIQ